MPAAAFASRQGLLRPSPPVPERDRAVRDMRSFLTSLHPQSAAEALRLLRNAFPDEPLSLRVAACGLSVS